jgi:serine/threonine protein kinase
MPSNDPLTDKPIGTGTHPAADSSSTQLILGQLGQYDLLLKLGEGGMGQVYKARHRLMDQVVALKVIHQMALDRPDAVERFHREIRALAKLAHPNIVRAQYADHVEGTHFLVMEYVAGPNLADVVREQGPLPVPAACAFIQQAACGLQHAFELGMVHRDIKPSNLLVAPDGQVKILDLGLALIRETAPDTKELTATGQVFGTYDYMAPEQWDDSHGVDIRADLYSLGCTLYFLLTGKPPFGAPTYSTATQKMKAHTLTPVPSLSASKVDIPKELDGILGRLMAKEPGQRYGSPQELIDALAPFAGTSNPLSTVKSVGSSSLSPTVAHVSSPSASTLHPSVPARDRRAWSSPRSTSRRAVAVSILALMVLGTAVGGIVYWQGHRPGPTDHGPVATPGPVASPAPLKIEKFEIKHTRMVNNEPMAPLTIDALTMNGQVHLGDKMKIEVQLSEPAHAYLVVLKPDGKRLVALPQPFTEPPPKQDTYHYPAALRVSYLLDSGAGLEAFLFIASRNPLPTFEEWRKDHGPLPWRRDIKEKYAFYCDGPKLSQIGAKRGSGDAPTDELSVLEKLQEHLKSVPNIEVFAFYAIPVEKRAP